MSPPLAECLAQESCHRCTLRRRETCRPLEVFAAIGLRERLAQPAPAEARR